MSLLNQDGIKKKQMNELFLKFKQKFKTSDNKKYKIEVIKNNTVYIKKARRHLSVLY